MEELTKIQEQLQEQLQEQQVNLKEVTLLFLDLSSTATGYTVVECNFENKTANFLNSGVIWFNDKWSHGEKYLYFYNTVCNYFNIVKKIDFCVAESYSINMQQRQGVMVSPEMHGVLKLSMQEIGVRCDYIAPQSWRSILKIKPDIEIIKGKKHREYKKPTKLFVEQYVKLPEQIESNITGQMRNVPSDLSDSLAISIAVLQKLNFKHLNFNDIKFQEEVNI